MTRMSSLPHECFMEIARSSEFLSPDWLSPIVPPPCPSIKQLLKSSCLRAYSTRRQELATGTGVGKMEANFSISLNISDEMLHESTGYAVLQIVSLVIQGITFVLGILGNGLVIWVAGFRMARTVTTLCYLNLALADFSFLATLPFLMYHERTMAFWLVPMQVNSHLVDINLFGSVFLIAFIALDRCICVLHPVWAHNHRTVTLATKLIIVPWILALVLTSQIFIFLTTVNDKSGNVYCTFNFAPWADTPQKWLKVAFTMLTARGVIRFVIGFSMPMSIVAICYGLIAVKLSKKGMINSSRSSRVLTAVVVSFFVCWFPFQLVALLNTRHIAGTKFKVLDTLNNLLEALAFFNSCLNPMLYVFIGQDFRKTLIHSLPASLERAMTEDSAPASDTTNKSASLPIEAELQA
ncbi:LOW QUALITY PROTEIN: hypothetical protein QTO34_010037, partial [Cnephaeus nilssonii]